MARECTNSGLQGEGGSNTLAHAHAQARTHAPPEAPAKLSNACSKHTASPPPGGATRTHHSSRLITCSLSSSKTSMRNCTCSSVMSTPLDLNAAAISSLFSTPGTGSSAVARAVGCAGAWRSGQGACAPPRASSAATTRPRGCVRQRCPNTCPFARARTIVVAVKLLKQVQQRVHVALAGDGPAPLPDGLRVAGAGAGRVGPAAGAAPHAARVAPTHGCKRLQARHP